MSSGAIFPGNEQNNNDTRQQQSIENLINSINTLNTSINNLINNLINQQSRQPDRTQNYFKDPNQEVQKRINRLATEIGNELFANAMAASFFGIDQMFEMQGEMINNLYGQSRLFGYIAREEIPNLMTSFIPPISKVGILKSALQEQSAQKLIPEVRQQFDLMSLEFARSGLSPMNILSQGSLFAVSFPIQMALFGPLQDFIRSISFSAKTIHNFTNSFFGLDKVINVFMQSISTQLDSFEEIILSQLTLRSVLGRQTGNLAIENALQLARTLPAEFKDILGTFRSLAVYPQVAPYISDKEFQKKLIEAVSGLALINPMQGTEGALFSIVEALSGSFRSLQMRFNISPELVEQLAGISKEQMIRDPKLLIEGLNIFVKKAIGEKTLEEYSSTLTKQIGNVQDAFNQLTKTLYEDSGIYKHLSLSMGIFAQVIGTLSENKELREGIKNVFEPVREKFSEAISKMLLISPENVPQISMKELLILAEQRFSQLPPQEAVKSLTGFIGDLGGIFKEVKSIFNEYTKSLKEAFSGTIAPIIGSMTAEIVKSTTQSLLSPQNITGFMQFAINALPALATVIGGLSLGTKFFEYAIIGPINRSYLNRLGFSILESLTGLRKDEIQEFARGLVHNLKERFPAPPLPQQQQEIEKGKISDEEKFRRIAENTLRTIPEKTIENMRQILNTFPQQYASLIAARREAEAKGDTAKVQEIDKQLDRLINERQRAARIIDTLNRLQSEENRLLEELSNTENENARRHITNQLLRIAEQREEIMQTLLRENVIEKGSPAIIINRRGVITQIENIDDAITMQQKGLIKQKYKVDIGGTLINFFETSLKEDIKQQLKQDQQSLGFQGFAGRVFMGLFLSQVAAGILDSLGVPLVSDFVNSQPGMLLIGIGSALAPSIISALNIGLQTGLKIASGALALGGVAAIAAYTYNNVENLQKQIDELRKLRQTYLQELSAIGINVNIEEPPEISGVKHQGATIGGGYLGAFAASIGILGLGLLSITPPGQLATAIVATGGLLGAFGGSYLANREVENKLNKYKETLDFIRLAGEYAKRTRTLEEQLPIMQMSGATPAEINAIQSQIAENRKKAKFYSDIAELSKQYAEEDYVDAAKKLLLTDDSKSIYLGLMKLQKVEDKEDRVKILAENLDNIVKALENAAIEDIENIFNSIDKSYLEEIKNKDKYKIQQNNFMNAVIKVYAKSIEQNNEQLRQLAEEILKMEPEKFDERIKLAYSNVDKNVLRDRAATLEYLAKNVGVNPEINNAMLELAYIYNAISKGGNIPDSYIIRMQKLEKQITPFLKNQALLTQGLVNTISEINAITDIATTYGALTGDYSKLEKLNEFQRAFVKRAFKEYLSGRLSLMEFAKIFKENSEAFLQYEEHIAEQESIANNIQNALIRRTDVILNPRLSMPLKEYVQEYSQLDIAKNLYKDSNIEKQKKLMQQESQLSIAGFFDKIANFLGNTINFLGEIFFGKPAAAAEVNAAYNIQFTFPQLQSVQQHLCQNIEASTKQLQQCVENWQQNTQKSQPQIQQQKLEYQTIKTTEQLFMNNLQQMYISQNQQQPLMIIPGEPQMSTYRPVFNVLTTSMTSINGDIHEIVII